MPDINAGLALGEIAGGIGRALGAKKQREYEEDQKHHDMIVGLVSSGLKDGTIKDPDAAFQFLVGGGKGKGKKGKELPPMLQSLIGATHKLTGGGGGAADPSTTLGGQDKASFQQPQQTGTLQFTTQSERTDADEAAKLRSEKNRFEQVTKPEIAARGAQREKEIGLTNAAKYGPGTLIGRINTAFDAFREREGRDPSPEEQAKLTDEARGSWQSAGRKVTDPEAYTKSWLADAATASGKPLTPQQEKVERLKARKAWALAGQSETPDQKLSRAKALETFKNDLVKVSSDDVKALSQSLTIGDHTTPYFDLGSVSGAKEKTQAAKAAIAQGIIPVSPKQAEQLEAAGAASQNLNGFLDQVKSRLPKDAAGRPLASVQNALSQFFQTDDELASAVAWDTSVLPMLRAMQVSGRITNLEFQTALDARPKLSDTVGVAATKIATINKMFTNATGQILKRGQSDTPAATPNRGQVATPADKRGRAKQALKTAGKADDDATVDLFLKNNPTFK